MWENLGRNRLVNCIPGYLRFYPWECSARRNTVSQRIRRKSGSERDSYFLLPGRIKLLEPVCIFPSPPAPLCAGQRRLKRPSWQRRRGAGPPAVHRRAGRQQSPSAPERLKRAAGGKCKWLLEKHKILDDFHSLLECVEGAGHTFHAPNPSFTFLVILLLNN